LATKGIWVEPKLLAEIEYRAKSVEGNRLRRLVRKRNLAGRVRQINPTGKSLLISRNHVKPGNKKYSAFAVGQNSATSLPVSPDERGVAHVTNARWDAVDA
jgi:hypothetical protein